MSFFKTGRIIRYRKERTFQPMTTAEITADSYMRTLSEAVRGTWDSVKSCARALGVNPLTAKNIWDAKNGASGVTLIKAMRESDEVLFRVLELAGRSEIVNKARAMGSVEEALEALNRLKGQQ
jgi:topoisomerase IA-like protein